MRLITSAAAVALAVGAALLPAGGGGRLTAQQPAPAPCGGRSNTPQVPCRTDVDAMMAALPDTAPAKPAKPRKVLVLGRATGYVHSSIPLAAKTVDALGTRTGAWTTTTTYDAADINAQNLEQYDAAFLSSTTGCFLDDPNDKAATDARRAALLDFVRRGKGLAGIHAASDSYHGSTCGGGGQDGGRRGGGPSVAGGQPLWPEFNRLVGGYFKFHWVDPQLITVKIDDPTSPLTAMFHGQAFDIRDETYTYNQESFSRENVHVLTSIDYSRMSDTDKAKETNPRSDHDYALSWIRREGMGRVFYEAHGHHERVYAMKPMLEHVLAGIQYALGDLTADDTPSAKAVSAVAQRGTAPGPTVVSPEVGGDRRVTFRILAPNAQKVELRSPGDIPGIGGRGVAPPQLTKNADGVWEATVGPVPAGAYRYVFVVDGVTVVDSRNSATSPTNTTVYSLAVVRGSDLFDTKRVPHGAVAAVHYNSTALGGIRRMHVYTPPGYETSRDRYPVLYLLHGAGDVDSSWSTVGRAGFILDNLIAANKAKPMIVAMPAGHVNGAGAALGGPPAAVGAQGTPGIGTGPDPFVTDFLTDLMPYVERNYRTLPDRPNRAIAGLSMGGNQTLNIAIPHLDKFAYVGVFSSGIISGGRGAAPTEPFAEAWERQNQAALDHAANKRGLSLLWFSTGKDDGLITNTRSTVDLLKKHGFKPVFLESEGAHTWLNWRDYLAAFAPQLFQPVRSSTSSDARR